MLAQMIVSRRATEPSQQAPPRKKKTNCARWCGNVGDGTTEGSTIHFRKLASSALFLLVMVFTPPFLSSCCHAFGGGVYHYGRQHHPQFSAGRHCHCMLVPLSPPPPPQRYPSGRLPQRRTSLPSLASQRMNHVDAQHQEMSERHETSTASLTLLNDLNDRLQVLENLAPDCLASFFEPALYSFSIRPGAQRLSITSTCFALQAILASSPSSSSSTNKNREELYRSFITMDTRIRQLESNDPRTPVSAIVQALLQSPWRLDDLFQVPVLLETLFLVDDDDNNNNNNNNNNNGDDNRRQLLGSLDEATAARIRQLIEAALHARPKRRHGSEQKYSDYILFHCTQVYALLYNYDDSNNKDGLTASITAQQKQPQLQPNRNTVSDGGTDFKNEDYEEEQDITEDNDWRMDDDYEIDTGYENDDRFTSLGGLPSNALPNGAMAQLSLALQRCAETSHAELCRQLALRSAGDVDAFDIMRLAYSLCTYLVATESLAGRTAGREMIRGQGPLPGTVVRPVNGHLVQSALHVFFAEQTRNGLWDKGQPIYRSFRRTGRNVGNAFIFSVDTLATLLELLPPQSFAPYLSNLSRTVDWIQTHASVEVLPDYCDPESGQCYGKAIRGWSSPHLSPDVGPQAWSTAQVIACVSRMRTVVDTLRHDSLIAEFRGQRQGDAQAATTTRTRLTVSRFINPTSIIIRRRSISASNPAGWNRLLDSDIGPPGGSGNGNVNTNQTTTTTPPTLKQVLDQRMIQPRLPSSSSMVSPSYSAVLFGPPGTAKTTICEALASRLGWDFVVIDTSVFLEDGLTNVASRIRYVFQRLLALRRCVILFDEIEEFCLDRETAAAGMESRMLTTAMLTALNDLRRAKRSIFFLATNRLRALDAAITRPGRFDLQLFVGTPNLEARLEQLRAELANVPPAVSSFEAKQDALRAYQTFLQRHWEDNAKFMNYLEGVQFARACADRVRQGYALDADDYMDRILQSQAAVMTIRGPVRQEFVASMGLSRL